MGLKQHLKGTAAVLTVTALAFALNGCGGKKEAKKFSVPKENLPAGVVSVIRPKPNNETIFVRALVQETARRNQVARLYTEALAHYDVEKGNAKDHEKLLKKAKAAWKSARDSASVAMFYAMGLSQLERTEGYDPYQKSKAMLTVPEIHLMPVAYAEVSKVKRVNNTKEEVFSKYSAKEIQEDLKKVPEGKELLAISQMYHTDGITAVDIMHTVNPNYNSSGRSWKDIGYDAAYRGAHVVKTAGKAAGTGLAAVAMVAAGGSTGGPVGLYLATLKTSTALIDTGVDAMQTLNVLVTGEENDFLNTTLKATGGLDTAASIVTFDLTKPIANLKGVGSYKFKEGATLVNQVKGFGYMTKMGLGSVAGELAKGNLKDAAKLINPEGVNNALGVMNGIYSTGKDINDAIKSGDKEKNKQETVVISSSETDDGKIETRTGLLSKKDKNKMTDKEKEEEKEKLKALGLTEEEVENAKKEAKQNKAAAATKSSQDLEKDAENVANAGGAGDYKNMFDMFIDSTRNGLIESILGPGGSMSDLDKILSEAAGEEMKATGLIISKDDKGNIKSVQVVGEKKNAGAPFASSKVAGTYRVYVPKEKKNVTVNVKDAGGKLSVTYSYYWGLEGKENKEATVEGPYTPSYDPQTGRGQLGEYSFQFTNNGGQMSLTVR